MTCDTQIRIHSDIDLLALNGSFDTLDLGVSNIRPYGGDAMGDLKSMRSDAERVLKTNFFEVAVDDAPRKSISLAVGSLNRKIDVVIANFWDTELWQKYRVKMAREGRILDAKVPAPTNRHETNRTPSRPPQSAGALAAGILVRRVRGRTCVWAGRAKCVA